jgi:hypothetical protein
MPPASRILVMVLVALAGVLAGFLSYRARTASLDHRPRTARHLRQRPGSRDSAAGMEGDTPSAPGAGRPGRFRTRYRT